MSIDQRAAREKAFHDEIYESQARSPLSAFYPTSSAIRARYRDAIFSRCRGQTILEYGCGLGEFAFALDSHDAKVSAIDISDYAIKLARAKAAEERRNIDVLVMDAEHLLFPDDSFDIVCGMSILHHLNLERAISEIRRVLKPSGRAIFLEPLGHNPLITLFRRLTPRLRSKDEHPLRESDVDLLHRGFSHHYDEYYYLFSFLLFPVADWPLLKPLVRGIEELDEAILRRIASLRKHSWQMILILEK